MSIRRDRWYVDPSSAHGPGCSTPYDKGVH